MQTTSNISSYLKALLKVKISFHRYTFDLVKSSPEKTASRE